MIDERKIIEKLQKRIDNYLNKYPDRKNSEAVIVIEEFIDLLEDEAKKEEES